MLRAISASEDVAQLSEAETKEAPPLKSHQSVTIINLQGFLQATQTDVLHWKQLLFCM